MGEKLPSPGTAEAAAYFERALLLPRSPAGTLFFRWKPASVPPAGAGARSTVRFSPPDDIFIPGSTPVDTLHL